MKYKLKNKIINMNSIRRAVNYCKFFLCLNHGNIIR